MNCIFRAFRNDRVQVHKDALFHPTDGEAMMAPSVPIAIPEAGIYNSHRLSSSSDQSWALNLRSAILLPGWQTKLYPVIRGYLKDKWGSRRRDDLEPGGISTANYSRTSNLCLRFQDTGYVPTDLLNLWCLTSPKSRPCKAKPVAPQLVFPLTSCFGALRGDHCYSPFDSNIIQVASSRPGQCADSEADPGYLSASLHPPPSSLPVLARLQAGTKLVRPLNDATFTSQTGSETSVANPYTTLSESSLGDDNLDDDAPDASIGTSVTYEGKCYTFHYRLGHGATSHVMYATTGDQEDPVAIKVFHKPQLAYNKYMPHDGSHLKLTPQHIFNEMKLLTKVMEADCALLTPLLSAFQDDINIYFVMRVYPQTLRSRICELSDLGMKVQVDEIRLYAAELLVALETLHSLRIFHRDLKPENILISPSGHLCLADFGLAVQVRPYGSFTKRKVFGHAGTVPYCAPEVWTSDQKGYFGAAADIWTYGLLLLEMFICNSTPYFGWDAREDTVDVHNFVSDWDGAGLISSILNSRPEDRPTLEDIKTHRFFNNLKTNWDEVKMRKYTPIYKPGAPRRKDPNSSVGFSTWKCTNSVDFGQIETQIHEFSNLKIDYACSENLYVDPLH